MISTQDPTFSPPVLAPSTAQEVAQILKQAADERRAVIPVGGRTMLALGTPPARAELFLSLEKLDRVLDYEPANLTVRTEAGITLAKLNRVLAAKGQCLPLDPPCPERATIGGILASNASGPLRIRYGTARDLVIGLRVALTDGQIVHGGGEVVKNVAGYDLPKLFIGSLGTLGVIVETTLKLAPLPHSTATLIASFQDADRAARVALRILSSPLLPLGLEILNLQAAREYDLSDASVLLARFAGIESAVARQLRDVSKWAGEEEAAVTELRDDGSLWARVRDFAMGHAVVAKIGVVPTRVAEIIRAAEETCASGNVECAVVARAIGVVYIALDGDAEAVGAAIEDLRSVALTRGGYLVLERAPAEMRARVDVWGPTRADFTLMRRLKDEFDPAGVLNPGRFVGGL